MSCMNLSELPQGCLSHILSLTSPSDVLRSAAVSRQFLLASESDAVWEKFLPSDCDEIISQSSAPPRLFASKKDLFLNLCRSPILFKNDTQSFALAKKSWKKCYMLGARALMITWGDTPQYWTWKSVPESRFPEVAELQDVQWLELTGRIHTKCLTPDTTYGAYLVFKLDVNYRLRGFDNAPVKVSISRVDEEDVPRNPQLTVLVKHYYLKLPSIRRRSRRSRELPTERDDGWMEIEMGKYRVDHSANNAGLMLEMTLREIEDLNWKSDLLVQGIELRPLD